MNIRIIKENDTTYFAKIMGISGVYAQGKTLNEVLDNLISVYEMVVDFKKGLLQHKKSFQELYKHYGILSKIGFKSIDLAL